MLCERQGSKEKKAFRGGAFQEKRFKKNAFQMPVSNKILEGVRGKIPNPRF
jgi:hypothetical protein